MYFLRSQTWFLLKIINDITLTQQRLHQLLLFFDLHFSHLYLIAVIAYAA
jgi:hypothetical protein